MKTTRTNKRFDCIAHKRHAQARIYDQIKSLSPTDEIEYFEQAVGKGPLADWWQELSRRSPSNPRS